MDLARRPGEAFRELLLALRHPSSFRVLEEMRDTQWLPPTALRSLQARKLADLLHHCLSNVGFYSSRDDLPSPEAVEGDPGLWSRLPVVDKETILGDPGAFTAPGVRDVSCKSTSGSTGRRFSFLVDRAGTDRERAAELLGYEILTGVPRPRILSVWGARLDVETGESSLRRRLREVSSAFRVVPGYDLDRGTAEVVAAAVRRFRPRLLIGYPGTLLELTSLADRETLELPWPEAYLATGERLLPHVKDRLEELTGRPVLRRYGSREFGCIACECAAGQGMHIMEERVLVEVLRDDLVTPCPPGEEGELVITDLDRRVMPLVRYRTGDLGILSATACDCGRGLRLLEELNGRTLDLVLCPDGSRIGGFLWPNLVRKVPGVVRFRLVQEESSSVTMMVELSPDAEPGSLEKLRRAGEERLAGRIGFRVEETGDFPVTASGKHRFVESAFTRNG